MMNAAAGILLGTPGDRLIRQRLAEDLADVEARFAAELLSDLPCVNNLVTHVERYRGKMLRPMLVLVSGMATSSTGGDITDAHRTLATVAEMVHMATLVHDDVLDEADVRRRGATINHLHGNEAAVMLGDYLISHAYHLCSSLDQTAPSRIIAEATNTVCEGELLQLANRENWELDEGTYLEIIRRKTASLCGTCCRLGALLSDAPPQIADGLYQFGEQVGVAFQIVDDLLDVTGSQEVVGKTLGRDLEKGKLTLPLIHHLRTISAGARRELVARLRSERSSGSDSGGDQLGAEVIDLLRGTDSIDYANSAAARLIASAKEALDPLPDTPTRVLLMGMADAVLTRKF